MGAKDRPTRQGPQGYARRNDPIGMGLIGRMLASVARWREARADAA